MTGELPCEHFCKRGGSFQVTNRPFIVPGPHYVAPFTGLSAWAQL